MKHASRSVVGLCCIGINIQINLEYFSLSLTEAKITVGGTVVIVIEICKQSTMRYNYLCRNLRSWRRTWWESNTRRNNMHDCHKYLLEIVSDRLCQCSHMQKGMQLFVLSDS